MDIKLNHKNLELATYNYDNEKEKSVDRTTKLDKKGSGPSPSMLALGGNEEEVKEGKWLKILTPNKLLTRIAVLLEIIKAGDNSYKPKNRIRQMLFLFYQYNKVTKKLYNNLIKSLWWW